MNQEYSAINALAQRFVPGHESLETIRSGRSVVVEIKKGSLSFILKAVNVNSPHGKNLANEAKWVNYLSRNGICVPCLIRSRLGNLVENTDDGDNSLTACCYEKIAVEPEPQHWRDPAFVQSLGRTMGEMHRLAPSCDADIQTNAPSWDSDRLFKAPAGFVHPSQSGVVEAVEKLRERLSSLSKSPANFGLIHDDLHSGNVFKAGDRVAILDFECLHKSWFLADISSALLFTVWIGPDKDRPETREKAAHFLRHLLAGYSSAHVLDKNWPGLMPLFLRLREIRLFTSMFSGLDVNQHHDNSLFHYVYASITEDRPFLDLDFKNTM